MEQPKTVVTKPSMNLVAIQEMVDPEVLAAPAIPRYERKDYRVIKRVFDFVGTVFLLLTLFPVFVLIFATIAISDGFPVMFRQKRVGQGGKSFWIYKFRTMRRDAEEILQRDPVLLEEYKKNFKLENDPRLLKCGKFLRSMTLDELPQLVNVLSGEMSLVGPRPLLASEQDRYGKAYSTYCLMQPGCAGLWQYRGRNALTFEQRVANDLEYYRTASLRRDLVVLGQTAVSVLTRKGAM